MALSLFDLGTGGGLFTPEMQKTAALQSLLAMGSAIGDRSAPRLVTQQPQGPNPGLAAIAGYDNFLKNALGMSLLSAQVQEKQRKDELVRGAMSGQLVDDPQTRVRLTAAGLDPDKILGGLGARPYDVEQTPGGLRLKAGAGDVIAGRIATEEGAKLPFDVAKSALQTREVQPGGVVNTPGPAMEVLKRFFGQGGGPGLDLSGLNYRNPNPAPAPQINLTQTTDKSFGTTLAEGVAKDLQAGRDKASAAAGTLKTNQVLTQLLNRGVTTGATADIRNTINNALATAGIISPEQVSNTEAFRSTVGQNVLGLMKQLGSGSAISNADLKFAERVAAGDITLTEQSIRKVIDIGNRAAKELIMQHNRAVGRQKGAPGVNENLINHYLVDEPGEYKVPELSAPEPGRRNDPLGIR